jgi:hypothetical protein
VLMLVLPGRAMCCHKLLRLAEHSLHAQQHGSHLGGHDDLVPREVLQCAAQHLHRTHGIWG